MHSDETRPDIEAAIAKVSLWEQHGQTIMLMVITGVLAFAAKALWESNTVQATMAAEIKNLSSQVSKLEGAVGAMQASYVTRAEFAVHEQRIQSLESGSRK